MNKFLIAGLYVFQTLVGCVLKLTGLVSISWAPIFIVPAIFAAIYQLTIMTMNGELIFDITKFINKAAENKMYFRK